MAKQIEKLLSADKVSLVTAKCDFHGQPKSSELSINKNEKLTVHKSENDWLLVSNKTEKGSLLFTSLKFSD